MVQLIPAAYSYYDLFDTKLRHEASWRKSVGGRSRRSKIYSESDHARSSEIWRTRASKLSSVFLRGIQTNENLDRTGPFDTPTVIHLIYISLLFGS